MKKSKVYAPKTITTKTDAIRYLVYANIDGQIHRSRHDTLEAAEARHAELLDLEANYLAFKPHLPTCLTKQQLAEAEAAFENLQERFPGRSLLWAVDRLTTLEPTSKPLLISEAIDCYLKSDIKDKNKSEYRHHLSVLGLLQNAAGGITHLHEFTPTHINEYFKLLSERISKNGTKRLRIPDGQAYAPATYNKHLERLIRFFSWAAMHYKDRQHPDGLLDGKKKQSDPGRIVPILSPSECQRLMDEVEAFEGGKLINYFAHALFAGIRPDFTGESYRLGLNQKGTFKYNFGTGYLHLSGFIAKTDGTRRVEMQPPLLAYFEVFPLAKYPIIPPRSPKDRSGDAATRLKNAIQRFRARCTVVLPHNVLRHTFITHLLTLTGSYAATASQSGNSERMIRKHYEGHASKAETLRFWSLSPKATRKRISAVA